ncbi:exopolysaccharide biosynthesis protein [Stieleria sp. TO1_6]|uniref:exopolysaccharide biosynthesis protein n=1 Tax=Stieleria tagensis TaxID=2956795 RepID=UPI00209B8983|nr:exopolysaccharide biosynthesis protein [Stieleria tagensis]MCO8121916.1 exopolysaccharide biosynthesis protein [Stieleria tagensis]
MSDSPMESMLERVDSLSQDQSRVSFGEALDAAGQRSFAPVLLLIGLIMLAPGPADIPGVPVVLGVLVIIVAVQILFKREHVWVPDWIEKREIKSERLHRMIRWLQTPAEWFDRITRRRFPWLVEHAGVSIIAIACIIIAAATPILEFVPFSANVAGAAIAAFGLALIAKDGLLAGVALAFSLATIGLVVWNLVG